MLCLHLKMNLDGSISTTEWCLFLMQAEHNSYLNTGSRLHQRANLFEKWCFQNVTFLSFNI